MAVSWGSAVGGGLGLATAGPIGAFLGSVTGELLAAVLPGPADLVQDILTDLGSDALKQAVARLGPEEGQRVNHDLQQALRDAFREGLYDVGGPLSFPKAWKPARDVPSDVVLSVAGLDPELAERLAHCMREIDRALDAERVLPLVPAADRPEASVYSYLEEATPERLAADFFRTVLEEPILDAEFPSLMAEAPGFKPHLRRHLLDRTLIHLGEILKQPERTRAWRAFNRLMLEDLRARLARIEGGQDRVLASVEARLAQPDYGAGDLAEMLTITGKIKKDLDEGLDALLDRVVEQHRETQARLRHLTSLAENTEIKIDWIVEILRGNLIAGLSTPADEPPAEGSPPFKGLEFFDTSDADAFFGREALTARLTAYLAELLRSKGSRRFLAVIGASGSGKSSLVRAGLLPALRRGEPLIDGSLPPAGSEGWQVRVFTPTAHPLAALDAQLAGDREPGRGRRRSAIDTLLVIDQFEELFTACKDEAERAAFVDRLFRLADPSGMAFVLITLRADFYSACADHDTLREAVAQQQLYIGAMSQAELRRAIEEPARRGNWPFEQGLVDLLLRDVGSEPGALPLLSHALLETWKRRRGRTMTLESYAETSGVRGAIAHTADSVYEQLSEQQQDIARSIFLRLTELGEGTQDTRRRATLSELILRASEAPQVEAVVKRLADERLLTTELVRVASSDPRLATGGERTVEVAHEALIREWRMLRRWLDEDREGLRLRRALTEDAREWSDLSHDRGVLYRGAKLAAAREWMVQHDSELNELERTFLAASIEAAEDEERAREAARQRELAQAQALAEAERQRADERASSARRLRSRARVLAVAFVIAGIASLAALLFGLQAQEGTRVARSNQLVAQAQSHLDDLDQALLLSVEASRAVDSPEARAGLLASLEANPNILVFLHGHRDWVRTVAFSPDGATVASGGDDGSVILWDVATRTKRGSITAPDRQVHSLAFSPDGRTLAVAGNSGAISLWDVASGQQRGQPLMGHTRRIYTLAWSHDGRLLASGSEDTTVRIWNTASLTLDGEPLEGHNEGVRSVAWSPDDSLLASGGNDSRIMLWNMASRAPQGAPLADYPKEDTYNDDVAGVAFSPDGRLLAAANWDGTVSLWDVKSGGLSGEPLVGHSAPATSVVFSPDGEKLISAGVDQSIIVWDVAGRQAIGRPWRGHTSWVNSLAISPDGRTLAAGSGDSSVTLWDLATSTPFGRSLGATHQADVIRVVFSPDGATLASAGSDGSIVVWDRETQQQRGRALVGHTGSVSALAYSPDGGTLASGSGDGNILLWNLATGQPAARLLTEELEPVSELGFSPDGQLLISASCATFDIASRSCVLGAIHLWDVPSRQLRATLPPSHSGWITGLSLGGDGATLASADLGGTVVLWDIPNERVIGRIFPYQTGILTSLAMSPDGARLALAGCQQFDDKGQCGAGEVQLWETATLRYRSTLSGHSQAVRGLAWSPDGATLATGSWDKTIRLWDAESGEQRGDALAGHDDVVTSLSFSADGALLASSSTDDTIRLWDPVAGRQIGAPMIGHLAAVMSVAVHTDGRRFASAGRDNTVRLWDLASGELDGAPLVGHTDWIGAVAWSPDGSVLASGGGDGIIVWDVATRSRIGSPLSGHTGGVAALAFSPNGRALLSGGCATFATLRSCAGGEAILWDVAEQKIVRRLLGHTDMIASVAYHPDGETVATGSYDGTIRFWNATSGEQIGRPINAHAEYVLGISFSPDGKMIASVSRDTTIKLWDVAQRSQIGSPLAGHTDSVFQVAWSRDGRMLASASADNSVKVWDVASGQLLRSFVGHTFWAMDVDLSPDGRTVISGGRDGLVLRWDISIDLRSWQERACAIAGRNLSAKEWKVYLPSQDHRKTCDQWELPSAGPQPTAALPTETPAPSPSLLPEPSATPDPVAVRAQQPTSTPTAGDLLVSDDFSDRLSGWQQASSAFATQSYVGGTFQIEVKSESRNAWAMRGAHYRDFVVLVEVTRLAGHEGGAFGVIFRAVDQRNRYILLVNDSGRYVLQKQENGESKTIAGPGDVPSLRRGGATNELRVEARGDRIVLAANGQEFAEVSDGSFPAGDVGLIAATFAEQTELRVSFDNVRIAP